jgi:hypothetical protein
LQLARPVLADVFEIRHRNAGRDDYQFSILDSWVCDATLSGGSARYINHSCTPNCRTTVLKVDNKDLRIGVFALRDILEGEELCYDYMVRHVCDHTLHCTACIARHALHAPACTCMHCVHLHQVQAALLLNCIFHYIDCTWLAAVPNVHLHVVY